MSWTATEDIDGAVFALEVAFSLKPRADKPDDFQIREWGKLPALVNGRVQPFDSIARNSLLVIRGNTDVPLEGNGANGKWGKWEELEAPLSEHYRVLVDGGIAVITVPSYNMLRRIKYFCDLALRRLNPKMNNFVRRLF